MPDFYVREAAARGWKLQCPNCRGKPYPDAPSIVYKVNGPAAERTAYTGVELLLMAAADGWGTEPFTLEQLTVRVWELYRPRFGILGFAGQYPDRHAVMSVMYNKKLVKELKYFRRRPDGLWSLTEEGAAEASRLRYLEKKFQ